MHTLNEQLAHVFGSQTLPYFPPKKLFPLSKTQLEERQFYLEKYLQGGNIPVIKLLFNSLRN